MKFKIIMITGLVLLLSGCSNSVNSSSKISDITTTSNMVQNNLSENVEELTTCTADITEYENNILKCKADGKELTFTTSDSVFEINGEDYSMLSNAVISNSFGIKVSADIVYDEKNNELKSCDVITPNGEIFSYNEGYYYDSCLRNIAVFHNENSSYNVDLSGLDKNYLSDFQSKSKEDFGIGGFIFSDSNNVVADEILPFEYEDDYGRHYGNEPVEIYKYYGIVKNVSEEKVNVVLNNSNIEVELTPCVICGIDKIKINDKICASFTGQKDYLANPAETNFKWAIIYSADDMECDVTVVSKNNIHAEYNGKSIIIEGQGKTDDIKKISLAFDDINYSYFDDTYEVYNVKKVMVE